METLRNTRKNTETFFKLLGSAFLVFISLRIFAGILILLFRTLPKQPYLEDLSSENLLLLALVLSPILESLLIIGLLWLFTRFTSRQIAMVATALLFGSLHYDQGVTWLTLLITSIMGYLFTYYYYLARARGVSGYWLIVLIHLVSNALSLVPEIIQLLT